MAICIVSGTIETIGGAAAADIAVSFRLDHEGNDIQFSDDGSALSRDERTVYTDVNGNFSVSLTQNTRLTIRVEELRLHRQVRVPETASATLQELLDNDLG